MDVNVNMFYCFWRSLVQSSSRPAVLFYKITGENAGSEWGFRPAYSAVNTPQPFWWADQPLGGSYTVHLI